MLRNCGCQREAAAHPRCPLLAALHRRFLADGVHGGAGGGVLCRDRLREGKWPQQTLSNIRVGSRSINRIERSISVYPTVQTMYTAQVTQVAASSQRVHA